MIVIMSIIKSFSVGNGDMFYIKHNSDNFTIIDCYLKMDNKDQIIEEIRTYALSFIDSLWYQMVFIENKVINEVFDDWSK